MRDRRSALSDRRCAKAWHIGRTKQENKSETARLKALSDKSLEYAKWCKVEVRMRGMGGGWVGQKEEEREYREGKEVPLSREL